MSGFRKCGIHPFSPKEVLDQLPHVVEVDQTTQVSQTFIDHLEGLRQGNGNRGARGKRKKLNVESGKSVRNAKDSEEEFEAGGDESGNDHDSHNASPVESENEDEIETTEAIDEGNYC